MDKLLLIVEAQKRRFPDGLEPFKMLARLQEECGELATEVQIWEDEGLKRTKHGEPDRDRTAGEIVNVLTATLTIADHYDLLDAVAERVDLAITAALTDGHLRDEDFRFPGDGAGVDGPIAKTMVVIRRPRDGAILVSGDIDEDGSGYERPLGGHIEVGERAVEAVRRELREEIGEELQNVRLLDVMENVFTLSGSLGHEIVHVFEADLADPSGYEIEEQVILDDPSGKVRVRWRGVDEDLPRLVPEGIERFTRDATSTGRDGSPRAR